MKYFVVKTADISITTLVNERTFNIGKNESMEPGKLDTFVGGCVDITDVDSDDDTSETDDETSVPSPMSDKFAPAHGGGERLERR